MASLHTLAFEIGTEEIPAFDLHKATGQLEKLVPEALDAVRIPHGTVSVHTTPRRLIVLAEDVADETEALQEVFVRQDRVRRRGQPDEGRHRLRARQGPGRGSARAPRGERRRVRVR